MFNFKNVSKKDLILFGIHPAAYLISKGVEQAVEKTDEMANGNASLKELKEEAIKQDIISQMRESQARVSQELAIAQRINTAEQVEIEEIYDTTTKGGFNANLSEGVVTGGLNGEGRKVTKRIYRFTGWHDGANEIMEQMSKEQQEE